MDCPSCSASVERIVRRSMETKSVKCSYLDGTLYIEYPGRADFRLLRAKLLRSGYRISEDTIRMTLSEDRDGVKEEFLSSFPGALEWVEDNDCVEVKVIRTGDTESSLISFFLEKGIQADIKEVGNGEEKILAESQIQVLRSLIVSVLLTLPLLWGPSPYIQAVLGTLIIVFPARCFFRSMIRSIRSGRLDMNVLVSLSTGVIYLFSLYSVITQKEDIKLYFLCQGVLVSMLLFGRYLESVTRVEATQSLKKLVTLIPRRARVIKDNGSEEEMDISVIKRKDRIALAKGERIPLDAVVTDGECIVDESVMTGESDLITKTKGDTLISGTVVRDGFVTAEVISTKEDSAIERVIEIVRSSTSGESPEIKKADAIASVFIPLVILAAVLVFFLWYFILLPHNLEKALITAAGVLVVACPCALGLAIPTSIMVGSGRAAEMGILFKNTAAFSRLASVDTVAVDKTGTITTGRASDGAETVRRGAEDFVTSMKKRGLDIILISGDAEKKAERVAGLVGIERVHYGAKSEEKAAIIESLRKDGHRTLMIGDGINDAPAMAVSSVSISIENGTEIAKDTADIIILNDEIGKTEDVFLISEKVMRNIRENLIWALVYNTLAIPLAAAGIMNPSIASAAMSFSSIAVLMNSLKLRKMEIRS